MPELSQTQLNSASDEELAVLARESVAAEAVLLKRYLKLIRYHANHYAAAQADADDLVQEGMLTLLYAIPKYQEERGCSFAAFAQTCILNRMRSLVKCSSSATPLADILELMDARPEFADQKTPESILIEKENYDHCRMQVMALLSAREWEILQCIMEGASYVQAAEKLGTSVKSVDNAMQRVRRKMRAVKSTEYFQ